ncbi:MAG: hypothetical protein JXR94_02710 [Candidatus Hydrogenedentes bacterium]|nr:hypothetical protein [Candidatus Hydrogenedentota bacterium]
MAVIVAGAAFLGIRAIRDAWTGRRACCGCACAAGRDGCPGAGRDDCGKDGGV